MAPCAIILAHVESCVVSLQPIWKAFGLGRGPLDPVLRAKACDELQFALQSWLGFKKGRKLTPSKNLKE